MFPRGRSIRDARRTIIKAIASFERTIVSANSPLDRYLYRDDRTALTPQAQRGMALFFSDRLACARCHSGFNLSGPTVHDGSVAVDAYVSQHRPVQHRRPRRVSRYRSRPHRRNARGSRHGPLSRADAAQHRRDRPLHARRQHPDARVRSSAHYASGGIKSPFKSPRLKGFDDHDGRGGRSRRLSRQPDRQRIPIESGAGRAGTVGAVREPPLHSYLRPSVIGVTVTLRYHTFSWSPCSMIGPGSLSLASSAPPVIASSVTLS